MNSLHIPEIFTFAQYWWFYMAFVAGLIVLLLMDIGIFHRDDHAVSVKEAVAWTIVWIALAGVFNFCFYHYCLWKFPQIPELMNIPNFSAPALAKQFSLEFLTGYVVEKSLSIDNLFVFVIVFKFFNIPAKYQHRVLFYGILGALIFRGIFIALGALLIQYQWVVIIFGVFLIFTGLKLFFPEKKEIDPTHNWVIRLFKRHFPVTEKFHGHSFWIKQAGKWVATPLFVGLLFLEMTDILFAVDSVPAIFAITKEPLIVFTSNMFAILGLRSLYFLLAGVVDLFHLLRFGLGIVLVFVGLKMTWLNHLYNGKFPTGISLSIICGVIGLSILLSLIFKSQEKNPHH